MQRSSHHFYKWLGRGGTVSSRTAKQETDQTVLTITKALNKTTNCIIFEPKKWRGMAKIFFRSFASDGCPPPSFKFVPAPLLVCGIIGYAMGVRMHSVCE